MTTPPTVILNERPERNGQCAKFWLFVTVDAEGNESPCGMNTGSGWMMMGNSKWENVEKMRPMAAKMAGTTGLKIVLREYHDCTDLEVFE